MYTEKKTIEIKNEYTEVARKELTAPAIKTSNKLIIASLAIAVVAVFGTFAAYYFENYGLTGVAFGFFVFAMLTLLLGAANKFSLKKSLKSPMPRTVFEYEIYADGIAAKEYTDDEIMHVSKYYNRTITKTLESKNYFFLYVNASSALVLSKAELSPAETATIKATYFKTYESERLELAPFKPGIPDFVQYSEEV